MRVFGLTGGLGSGKSTVGARFRARGVPVIDADLVARDVVAPGSVGLAKIVEAFGAEVLLPDGALDRPALAKVVFGDPEKRKRLDRIIHPLIGAESARRVGELAAAGEQLACYEAALLVENGLAEAFRPLVVVAVPEEVQVARAMARDRATEAEVRARIASQLPLGKKVAAADYVIENSGERAETERRADDVLDSIRAGGRRG